MDPFVRDVAAIAETEAGRRLVNRKWRRALFFLHTFTDWFEKYTNSPPEEPLILAICYVK